MGTYTTNLNLYKPSIGENGWGTLVSENFDKIDSYIPGIIQLYAGSSVPSGWLICNGQAVSRTTYAALYAVIGTTYGTGDGSTTFNVPNLVNKTVRGSNSLGKTGGADTVTLSTAQIPAHTHGVGTLATNNTGAHTHKFAHHNNGSGQAGSKKAYNGNNMDATVNNNFNTLDGYMTTDGAHTHTISGATDSTGSGSAVTITNPYVMLHYIIKT